MIILFYTCLSTKVTTANKKLVSNFVFKSQSILNKILVNNFVVRKVLSIISGFIKIVVNTTSNIESITQFIRSTY